MIDYNKYAECNMICIVEGFGYILPVLLLYYYLESPISLYCLYDFHFESEQGRFSGATIN